MDIEQLKLIIETVKSVSGDAQSLVIWWLVMTHVTNLLSGVLFVGGVYVITVKILCHLQSANERRDDYRKLKGIRDILYPSACGPVLDHEYMKMCQRVEELIERK
jgi:hypothetical protein